MSIYKLSFKNLKRRKIRSALTMIGIIIGVIALVTLVGIGSGIQSYMNVKAESMKDSITISNSSMSKSGEFTYLDQNTVSKIKNMPQLYDVKEEIDYFDESNNIPIIISGINDWSQMKINGTPGVVIIKSSADSLGYKIGSKIKIKNQEMTVTGITDSGPGIGEIYIDSATALKLTNNGISSVSARVKGDPEVVSKQIQNQIGGITVTSASDIVKGLNDLLSIVTLFVGAIASVALLVGVISIINIMLVNVTERTREIGVLKAIGFTNKEILGNILSEAGLLGFVGATVGVIIAAILLEIGILYISHQVGIEDLSLAYMLPLWLVVGVIGGATLLSVLAGLYPAWRASRLNVVESLRYE